MLWDRRSESDGHSLGLIIISKGRVQVALFGGQISVVSCFFLSDEIVVFFEIDCRRAIPNFRHLLVIFDDMIRQAPFLVDHFVHRNLFAEELGQQSNSRERYRYQPNHSKGSHKGVDRLRLERFEQGVNDGNGRISSGNVEISPSDTDAVCENLQIRSRSKLCPKPLRKFLSQLCFDIISSGLLKCSC